MAKNSSIEWTDHTFNPWWGCSKVSPGCEHCYAETWSKRVGAKVWGTRSPRRFFTDKHWNEPLRWNEDARALKRRPRVFCASMADVFEDRGDLNAWRERLWKLVTATPRLDWLLLTKRPQNVSKMAPWTKEWPENVWLGTTVEDQTRAKERLPHLLKHNAYRRFLSCEPLIGAVDLAPWLNSEKLYSIDWVIAGGESGSNARPMLPSWARKLRDQCNGANVPFHFKQWGHWAPAQPSSASNSKVRKFSDDISGLDIFMAPQGKKLAGRRLDGATWDQLPQPIHANQPDSAS